VLTSAPEGTPAFHGEGQKLIGARNESSVLFSMGALSGRLPGGHGAARTDGDEASGLIDIRQLGARLASPAESNGRSRIDDIMNLGSGSLGVAMVAPVLSAPSLDKYTEPSGLGAVAAAAVSAQARNRVLMILAISASLFFVIAAIGTAVWVLRGSSESSKDKSVAAGSATSSASAAPAIVASNEANDTRPTPDPAPPPPSPSDQPTNMVKNVVPSSGAPTATPTRAAVAQNSPKETPSPAPAPVATSDQPFNMGEARSRLGAISDGVQSCRKGSTTGTGRVVITFSPSGYVQSAVLTPGSPFDGTPTGSCVAARFRAAHVPAFAGSPFPVSKSFTIN
jgi:hypothetical protein